MARGVACAVIFASLALAPLPARGARCSDGIDAYLEVLEGRRELPYHGFYGATSCLECEFETGGNRWTGPEAAAALRRCRESPLRARLAAALRPYLLLDASSDSLAALRARAAATLASYGVAKLDSIDVYAIVVASCAADPAGLVLNLPRLAAMDDARTLPFVTAAYDSLRAGSLRRHRERLAAILNCVYHLSGDGAVRFAERVARTESDSLLVERARRVVSR